jgi:cation diffusion facilitator family transporter
MLSIAILSEPIMNEFYDAPFTAAHDHVFLGAGHEKNERKTWGVIVLCTLMMLVEIIGGRLFGSLALVADGLHMSTHAGAMLIAALAYTYARKHANDPRFVFGTGKLGDLAGFTSAIILAMIAMLIGYEAVVRLTSPVPIHFAEAIPIAVVGLLVNIASAWLLSGDDHAGHSHSHGHGNHGDHGHDEEVQHIETPAGLITLSIFEDGTPPVFRIHAEGHDSSLPEATVTVTTIRSDGARQVFTFSRRGKFLQSTTEIPEPHGFKVVVSLPYGEHEVVFEEHAHEDHESGVDSRDHNMRAAYIHIIADAAVSVLAIVGLLLAKIFGWLWMDPLAGIVGAIVIANWAYGLIRDTGSILMDMSPGEGMVNKVRSAIDAVGDKVVDLHIWRLGPGHFSAVVSVVTAHRGRESAYYHAILRRFKGLSHITVEVHNDRPTSKVCNFACSLDFKDSAMDQ